MLLLNYRVHQATVQRHVKMTFRYMTFRSRWSYGGIVCMLQLHIVHRSKRLTLPKIKLVCMLQLHIVHRSKRLTLPKIKLVCRCHFKMTFRYMTFRSRWSWYSFINMLSVSTGIFYDKLRPQILSVGTTANSPLNRRKIT
jgi:hypothetical protein